ncbi:MAG TPA: N-acetyltransferase [Terriglobales bacterium]|nr:N-acetyltransferase [Terriglobales bacterium]
MADVLDLRQFRSSQLEALLAAETAEWSQLLDWDYAPSADLIRQYVEARILPGYVLVERSRGRALPYGYGFFIYEAHKGMVGNLFVLPDRRDSAHLAERELLTHMLATLRASPGLERIEAQLMPFPPAALAPCFAAEGFHRFRRNFLQLGLRGQPPPAEAAAEAADFPGLRLEPWGGATFEEAAQLILHAYHHHIDSRINDQYRSFSGALRFMHNIAHYPGCGAFDPAASFLARSLADSSLEGMILTSRVKPDVAHITQICVLPQSQRRGLGRALIARCLVQLRRRGLRAATLTVTAENLPACTLYRQLGFTPLAEFDAYVWERNGHGAPA